MEAFLIYIAKVSIAAGAFYVAYLLLFQKQKQFNFNRIYLPVSMLLSFVIPVITFTTVNYVELVAQESYSPSISSIPSSPLVYDAPAFEFEWYHYLFGMYILGVTGFLLHLLIGHLKAMHIIRTSRVRQLFNYLIHITDKDVHPFSFFSKIVLSERMLSNSDLEMIVNHEKIHVREKHTYDILFAEFMFVLQWFNPFAWLIKSAVRNNLEFKTDDEITKTYDPQKYQLAMVALADKKEIAPFLTALNGSQLKNRIMMMKQKTENKFRVVRQLAVLPLLAILVMGLSNKETKTEFVQPTSKIEVIVDGKVIPSDDKNLTKVDFSKGIDSEEVINALDIRNVIANSLAIDGDIKKLYILTDNYVPGTNPEFEENTTRNIVLDENKLTEEYFYAIDGELVDRSEFLKQGKIGFENVIFLSGKDATEKYGEEHTIVADAISGIPNFVVKDGNEDWEGENTNLDFYEEKIYDPVMEKFNEHIKSIMKDGIATLDPTRENFPYTILNYEEVKQKVTVKQEDLKYGEVIPPKEAVKEFGEKGENGVLIFSTEAGSLEDFRKNYNSDQGQIQTDQHFSKAKKYSIVAIEISGNSYLEKSKLLQISGLKIGQEIEMPGNETTSAIEKLWDQGLFSDVKISASKIVDDNIWLNVYLEEKQTPQDHRLPTEAEWEDAVSKKGRIIIGKITDKDGSPIVMANVIQYDKPGGRIVVGAITDSIGAFIIKLASNHETLYFSQKGYKSKEVSVEGKEEVKVVLEKDPDGSPNKSGQQNSDDSGLRSSNDVRNLLIIVDDEPISEIPDKSFDYKSAKIEDFGKLINVAPENIESIEVLNDAASIAVYGERAKNGVLRIKTKKKEGAINSIHELRSFITREIVFPEAARDNQLSVNTFHFHIKMNKNGEGFTITGKPENEADIVDAGEIVVTALRNFDKDERIKGKHKYFENEAIRVFKLPQVDMQELEGKYVKIDIKYILQD